MEKFLQRYIDAMNRYRSGEFGEANLTLSEIFIRAEESNLLEKMSLSEIQQLLERSSGISKQVFLLAKKKKLFSLEKMRKLEAELQSLKISQYYEECDYSGIYLADNLKLHVCYCDTNDLPEDVEACLSPSDDTCFYGEIKISKECDACFPYMHEIIHYVRDVGVGKKVTHIYTRKRQGKTDSPEEQDVNYLTAAATMPLAKVSKDLDEYEKSGPSEDRAFIARMSNKYGQTEDTVLRRFIEVRSLIDYQLNFM